MLRCVVRGSPFGLAPHHDEICAAAGSHIRHSEEPAKPGLEERDRFAYPQQMNERNPITPEPPSLRPPPTFAGSALAEAARNAVRHMSGGDGGADPGDRTELWGRRIGRAFSLLGCVALAIYLYVTYLR
jgi:hypothetical protein